MARKTRGHAIGDGTRQLAYAWIARQEERRVPYHQLVACLVKDHGVTARTAKNWIRTARAKIAAGATINPVPVPSVPGRAAEPAPGTRAAWVPLPSADPPLAEPATGVPTPRQGMRLSDVDGERWEQVAHVMRRKDIWHHEADTLRDAGDANCFKAEALALDYQRELARLLAWYSMPPDRLLSQPEVRAKAIEEIERAVDYMTERELVRLRDSIAAQLDRVQFARQFAHKAASADASADMEALL